MHVGRDLLLVVLVLPLLVHGERSVGDHDGGDGGDRGLEPHLLVLCGGEEGRCTGRDEGGEQPQAKLSTKLNGYPS